MPTQIATITILMSVSIAMGQHSSLQCSSANGNQDECFQHHVTDKLEQMSALERKMDNTVQQIAQQIQSFTGESHSNSDLSCPVSIDNAATDSSLPENCLNLYNKGHRISDIYTIYEPLPISPFRPNRCAIQVYCDMTEHYGGPGWMLIQRRQDGSVNFNRTWAEYSGGFGDLAGEHWLGNDNLVIITSASTPYELRVDMLDWEGERRYARYSSFAVQSFQLKYRLSLGRYAAGDAGDAMQRQNGTYFSTHDMDNDSSSSWHYAQQYGAGWWWQYYRYAALNNPYHSNSSAIARQGIYWRNWHGDSYSLKHVQMKIRPVIT